LAILPVGLTRRIAPEPVEPTQTGFKLLYRRSQSAFAGALLSGLVTGSFWALGAVFASRYAKTAFDITLFMSIAIAGGAIVQYPIGWLSDRVDRRRVLLLLTLGVLLSSATVALSTGRPWFLLSIGFFGACAMPLYAISLATAADVCEGDEFVTIGTSVLLLNALGAALAPLILGQLMTHLAATALFWSFAVLCTVFGVYLWLQLRSPRAVPVTEQTPFKPAANDAAPAAFEMDPRTQTEPNEDPNRDHSPKEDGAHDAP
jgi:MFS family permease